jgi:hypothetical protein
MKGKQTMKSNEIVAVENREIESELNLKRKEAEEEIVRGAILQRKCDGVLELMESTCFHQASSKKRQNVWKSEFWAAARACIAFQADKANKEDAFSYITSQHARLMELATRAILIFGDPERMSQRVSNILALSSVDDYTRGHITNRILSAPRELYQIEQVIIEEVGQERMVGWWNSDPVYAYFWSEGKQLLSMEL